VRQLSDEVALELSKVEWPTREKVRRSTTIVVGATLGSALAFWLYDILANKGVSAVTGSNHPLLYGLAAGVLIYLIRALGSRFLAGKA
jgi:preprotein translocase SecE subunit